MRHGDANPRMMFVVFKAVLIGVLGVMNAGCISHLVAHPPSETLKEPFGFGHIHVWQDKPSGRIFLPELASLEITTKDGKKRYRVEIKSSSSSFFVSLTPGSYRVTRVFVQEGGFRASAEVPLAFDIPEKGVVYLGDWRFHIEPPNFSRSLEVTVLSDPIKARVELRVLYPELSPEKVVSAPAEPSPVRSRLFEITPYPRFRWFHRHNPT